ncbi:hypothetical protein AWM68_14500 [Fictibacillus phosphorivorans]|uniref:Alpha-ribazole phosphatase n=2 Tax=Fictibacillus phosphorivorans TaxID=1221500 RepID=A0A163Q113_9BACL|nr:hypothetical protein AWM68_14500 [Fictibacillus phosphorivorans]
MVRRMAVTLIRHGLTKANQEKRYIGHSDHSLCEKGKTELLDLKPYHGYLKPDLVLTSDRRRCLETVEILYPDVHIKICEEFRELNFGDWENKTYADLCKDPTYQKWLNQPKEVCPPNGEDFTEFKKRVSLGWEHKVVPLFKNIEINHVVILTHGGPIRYLLSQFAQEKRDFWEWNARHGQGYTLNWEGGMEGRCTLLQAAPLMEKQNG